MSAYLTPLEVADLLNIGRSTVYRAINNGEQIQIARDQAANNQQEVKKR